MQLLAQVGHEEGAHSDVHSGRGQALAHFRGAGCVASMEPVQVQGRVQGQHLLPLQLLQVADCQLQHISLLQLGDALALVLKRVHHQLLQLVEALVDASPPLPLQGQSPATVNNFTIAGHMDLGPIAAIPASDASAPPMVIKPQPPHTT